MNPGAAIILVAGIAGAAFLYYRSQQQQAAALAAAQAAPGAGLVTKIENTGKVIAKQGPRAAWQAVQVPVRTLGSAAGGIAGGVSSGVSFVKGLF